MGRAYPYSTHRGKEKKRRKDGGRGEGVAVTGNTMQNKYQSVKKSPSRSYSNRQPETKRMSWKKQDKKKNFKYRRTWIGIAVNVLESKQEGSCTRCLKNVKKSGDKSS